MQPVSAAVASASAPEFRGRRMGLSRAARRDVRQAAQLANELNLHSFRIHVDGTITWVRWREDPPPQVQQESTCNGTANPKTGELSRRARKSIERARAHRELHEKAARFRCAAAVRWWCNFASLAKGAREASVTRMSDSGDGVPDASTFGARDSVTPSMARTNARAALMPQHGTVRISVPAVVAGCGSPRTGVEGPSGIMPQSMCASVTVGACSPRAGARHGSSQPLLMPALHIPPTAEGMGGPSGAAPTANAQQSDTSLYILQFREQHFIPFMQFHAQQGVPEHESRMMYDQYERVHMMRVQK